MTDVQTKISSDSLINEDMFITTLTLENGLDIEQQYVAKIDIPSGIPITGSMIEKVENMVKDGDKYRYRNDLRVAEYGILQLPIKLEVGDFVDVRLRLPTGADFIVLSKKEIVSMYRDTVFFLLTEDEIVLMSGAIVESYMVPGSNLYALSYAEPGIQAASSTTYVPTPVVEGIIKSDPNVRDSEIRKAIESLSGWRSPIDEAKSAQGYVDLNDEVKAASDPLTAARIKAMTERENYLLELEEGTQ
jgi:hypothetical protein